MPSVTKDTEVQPTNALEYDGPDEDGHMYAETMSPMVVDTPRMATTTARLDGSGIELLAHAVNTMYETTDWHMKNRDM